MATFKEALQYAQQNPNSDFANQLRKGIESGQYADVAQKEGVDISNHVKTSTTTEVKKEPGFLEPGGTVQKIGTGIAKGALSTIHGMGILGEKVLEQTAGRAVEAITSTPKEQLGANIYKPGTPEYEKVQQTLEAKGGAEKIGKFAEQVGEWFIPAGKVAKVEKLLATKVPNLVEKLIPLVGEGTAKKLTEATLKTGAKATVRAIEGGGIVSIQSGGDTGETKTAAIISAALPIAVAVLTPVKNLVGRLFTNLASGLSGVSQKALEAIHTDPSAASQAVIDIAKGGQAEVLQKNAKKIVEGVSRVRQEARTAYGDALEALSTQDIDPTKFRSKIQPILDKYGSRVEGDTRILENIEFDNPVNIKRAGNIIDKITQTNLDGKSLKRIIDFIDNQRYKIATTDERLAFNSFVGDMVKGLKDSINESTDKLAEMNKKYTQDMQLIEGVQSIFGKIKFKNIAEVNKVAKKLESLFSMKGLEPETIDNFLTKVGISPAEFKSTEATRQISDITQKAGSEGISIGELMRNVTSSVVTPKMVRDAYILTGYAEPKIKTFFEKVSPASRAAFIELFAR